MILNGFKSEIFPIQSTEGTERPGMLASHPLDLATGIKILILKQMIANSTCTSKSK